MSEQEKKAKKDVQPVAADVAQPTIFDITCSTCGVKTGEWIRPAGSTKVLSDEIEDSKCDAHK